ncbi:MAG: hypothetical protein ACJ8H8_02860, partial [Geminicoccaceae bacterium]
MDAQRRLIALVLFSTFPIALGSASGQTVKVPPAPAAPDLPDQVFAEAKPAAAEGQGAPKKDDRLAKIKQLTFDRRPSEILKAWSAPEGEAPRPKPAAKGETETKPDPFEAEWKAFRRHVTRGEWPAVRDFLAKLPEAESKAAYERLIQALPSPPAGAAAAPMPQNGPQFQEKNAFSNGDVMALAGIAPHGLDDDLIAGLGTILRMALDQGNTVADCLERLKATPAA